MIFGFLKSPALSPRLRRLHASALFASLTPLELRTVDSLLHERNYLGDEIIFDEGEEGQALYMVMSGRVLISRQHEGAAETLAELTPGAFFGDLALLDDSPRSAQARACGDCALAVFFRADFVALMNNDGVIGYKISLALARHLAQRLRDWMSGKLPVEAL
ncbi:cyclic nucleotide-binding domain-containing protein [Janthinobacterium sp.]|uniref:cyclic nucleotide-binding domain-containing protein n=1 Tax=Janthinobacterium sp. TaxID=1871054 RepID=UPI00293D6A10|nr:cyclic nucleotide-binding domain-containing protein [Janthinobacterium sp.]